MCVILLLGNEEDILYEYSDEEKKNSDTLALLYTI